MDWLGAERKAQAAWKLSGSPAIRFLVQWLCSPVLLLGSHFSSPKGAGGGDQCFSFAARNSSAIFLAFITILSLDTADSQSEAFPQALAKFSRALLILCFATFFIFWIILPRCS